MKVHGLRLIELKPKKLRGWKGLLTRVPQKRDTRRSLPEPVHTYKTVMYGQEVEVKVLPSAEEADGSQWKKFTARPKSDWVETDKGSDSASASDGGVWRWTMNERSFRAEMKIPFWRKK